MTELTNGERLLDRARNLVAEAVAAGDVADGGRLLADAMVNADPAVRSLVDAASSGADVAGFGRAYTSLVLDNDAQPVALQLSPEELRAPIGLLASFFLSASDVQTEANRVLRIIEDKFARGRFSQAILLLQLFETDAPTQRRNERNLWYEEMVLNYLGSRAHSVSAGDLRKVRNAADAASSGDPVAVAACSRVVSELLDVRLHVRCHQPGEVAKWRDATEGITAGARRSLSAIAPPARWRPVHLAGGESTACLQEHFTHMGMRDYTVRFTRAVYFHLVSPGRNNFEPMIIEYMRWLERTFDAIPTRVMPDLHRQMVSETRGLNEALATQWEAVLAGHERREPTFAADALAEATGAVFSALRVADIEGICEGDYDFGGLVFDHLFDVQHAAPDHGFRLHRLT